MSLIWTSREGKSLEEMLSVMQNAHHITPSNCSAAEEPDGVERNYLEFVRDPDKRFVRARFVRDSRQKPTFTMCLLYNKNWFAHLIRWHREETEDSFLCRLET